MIMHICLVAWSPKTRPADAAEMQILSGRVELLFMLCQPVFSTREFTCMCTPTPLCWVPCLVNKVMQAVFLAHLSTRSDYLLALLS